MDMDTVAEEEADMGDMEEEVVAAMAIMAADMDTKDTSLLNNCQRLQKQILSIVYF